jgi:hypothetical protein
VKSKLIVSSMLVLTLMGCKTGPDTAGGITSCEQLRACTCEGGRASNPAVCNAIDGYEGQENGQDVCRLGLAFVASACGTPLQFRPAGAVEAQNGEDAD